MTRLFVKNEIIGTELLMCAELQSDRDKSDTVE